MVGSLRHTKVVFLAFLIVLGSTGSCLHASWLAGLWGAKETEDVGLTAFRRQATAMETELGRELDMVDIIANHVRIVPGMYGNPIALVNTPKLVGHEAWVARTEAKERGVTPSPALVLTEREVVWAERAGGVGRRYYLGHRHDDRIAALYGIELMMRAARYFHSESMGNIHYEFIVFKKNHPEREYPFADIKYTLRGTGDDLAQESAVRWAREFGVYETGFPKEVTPDALRARIAESVGSAAHEEHKSASDGEDEEDDHGAEAVSASEVVPLLSEEEDRSASAATLRHRLVPDDATPEDE
jgi:hypothetical protein